MAIVMSIGLVVTGGQAQVSPGPLAQDHAHLDSAAQCFSCHGGRRSKSRIDDRCSECHAEIASQVRNNEGLHGREKLQKCSKCHPDHAGRDFELIQWKEGSPERFDHRRSGWPLTGQHRKLSCEKCHNPKYQTSDLTRLMRAKKGSDSWLGLEPLCSSCHEDLHRGTLGTDCASCHRESEWRPASGFDHSRTRYPLDGAHVEVKCSKCHKDDSTSKKVFSPLEHDQCSSCHKDVHGGQLGADCASCHVNTSFKTVRLDRFNHGQTKFPLRGKHQAVKCSKCHAPEVAGYKKEAFSTCSSCHAETHAGRARWEGQGTDCATCHDERNFVPSTLTVADHARTRYPLEGKHRQVACKSCHGKDSSGVILQPAFASCTDCHADDHAGQLLERSDKGECESCHTVSGWIPSTFGLSEHEHVGFKLTGAHVDARCRECHGPQRKDLQPLPARVQLGRAGVALKLQEQRCADCHLDPHAGTIGDSCESCHTVDRFRPSTVDAKMHGSFEYGLRDAHRTVPCVECHEQLTRAAREIHLLRANEGTPLTFSSKAMTCSACHKSPHAEQFGARESDCGSCHDERAFVPAGGFDHGRDTNFPLTGEHRRVACIKCHDIKNYKKVSSDCKDCHGSNLRQLSAGEAP